MSLINKMLKDLAARQSGVTLPDPQSIYQGLRPTGLAPAHRRLFIVVGILCGLVLAGIGSWFGWQHLRVQPPEASTPVTTPMAASVPAVVAEPAQPEPSKVRKAVVANRPTRPVAKPVLSPASSASIELNNRTMTKDDQAENKYREGIQFIRQTRTDDAEQRLRAALALNPGHVNARESLAALLVEQGRWLEAQALLEEGLKVLPNQVTFGFLLARLFVEQGKDAAGLQLLERLQPHAGGDPNYLAFMATLYQRTGRHADAVGYFKQVTSARPAEGRWWVGLGISLEAMNDRDNSRAAFQRAKVLPLDLLLAEFVSNRLTQLPSR